VIFEEFGRIQRMLLGEYAIFCLGLQYSFVFPIVFFGMSKRAPAQKTKLRLIVFQSLYAIGLPFWPQAVGLSQRAFMDGPSVDAFMYVLPIWPYPFVFIGCTLGAWYYFRQGEFRKAKFLNIIPLPFSLAMWTMLPLLGVF